MSPDQRTERILAVLDGSATAAELVEFERMQMTGLDFLVIELRFQNYAR